MFNISRSFVFFLIFSVLNQAKGQTEKAFSLQEAIDYAEKNSQSIKLSKLDIKSANADIKDYTSIGLPQVEGLVSYTYFPQIQPASLPDFITKPVAYTLAQYGVITPQQAEQAVPGPNQVARFGANHNARFGVQFSQLAFDGSYLMGLKAIKQFKVLKELEVSKNINDLHGTVAKSYLACVNIQAAYTILEKNISNLEKLLFQLRETKKQGFIEQLDVDRVELSFQNLKADYENLQYGRNMAQNYLKMLIGYPIEGSILLTDNLETLSQAISNDLLEGSYSAEGLPTYKMLKQSELLNNLNVQRLKNAYYPSIAIFGNIFENLNRNNLFSSQESGFLLSSLVGIQANIPIFDGFSKKAKIEKAMVDRDKFSQQLEMFERSVALQIQNARQAYFKAQNTLTKRKETLILAEKIYNTTKIKFKEGVGGSLDVTNSEREYFAAQNNVLNAQYDLLNAQYDLLQAYGKL